MNSCAGINTFANRYKPNAQTKVYKRTSTFSIQEKIFYKISTPSNILKTAITNQHIKTKIQT